MRSQRRQTKKGHGRTKSPRRAKSRRRDRRGRRYTDDQRHEALKLIAAGMARHQVAKTIGATTETLRLWVRKAEAQGTMPASPRATVGAAVSTALAPVAPSGTGVEAGAEAGSKQRSPFTPQDPGQGLAPQEQEAILEVKKRHPSMGPAQIRAQLKRHKGWRLAVKAIARVLNAHGYELVHRGSRPQGASDHRFEAPRPNALWQADFAELRLPGEKLQLLVLIDDFSRFCVGHAVADSQRSPVATATLRAAMARHGKPERVRTDRGGAFVARSREDDFARVLETELIDHSVGRSYHPQGGGKVEAFIGTIRRELWDVEEFATRAQAEARIDAWVTEYNHQRAHLGIDGLTPADRYFGRSDQVLAAIDAASRHRQGQIAQRLAAGAPVEEVLGLQRQAPLEVLRLVLADGHLELRFLGARVALGPVQP
ncbi:IS3 family transposase [Myxococcota bacterium]